jgi:hypothetical protein
MKLVIELKREKRNLWRITMTDGGVLAKWKDYQIYFGTAEKMVDKKTAQARLRMLKIRIPRRGAPLIRREALDRIIDAKTIPPV